MLEGGKCRVQIALTTTGVAVTQGPEEDDVLRRRAWRLHGLDPATDLNSDP
jgi:hypothetical protein